MLIPRRRADASPEELRRIILAGRETPLDTGQSDLLIGEWESTFADFIGTRHGVAVGSGRHAMQLILASLKLPPGSEIIIPAYTLKDLIPLIQSLQLIPVPADIDPLSWNISAETIRPRITEKTGAILVLHLFGNPCDMPDIVELARKHNLKLIEDCAHSAGSTLGGRQTGSFGDAAFFSFETIKPINTYGGGMVVTDNQEIATEIRQQTKMLIPPDPKEKAKAIRLERFLFNSGFAFLPLAVLASGWGHTLAEKAYRLVQHAPGKPVGYGSEQALLGQAKLKTLQNRITRRRELARQLNDLLPGSCFSQSEPSEAAANYYFYVIQAPGDMKRLRRHLLYHGIDAGIRNEIADNCGTLLGYDDCHQSASLFNQSLQLPLHEAMDIRQIERLASLLAKLV